MKFDFRTTQDVLALLGKLRSLDAQHKEVADENHPREAVDGGLLSQLLPLLLPIITTLLTQYPELVSKLLELIPNLLDRFGTAPHPAKTAPPTTPSTTFPPMPAPPTQPAPTPTASLQSWMEEFWHDWFKGYPDGNGSDYAPSGSSIASDIVGGRKGAPPKPVIRFMTGVLPMPSTVPFKDERPAPFAIDHVFELVRADGHVDRYVLSANETGERQPFPDFAHVQFGPRFQDSHGWDVTLRLESWTEGPRKLRYYAVANGAAVDAEPVEISIAKA